jgi:hypothetical protein
MDVKAILLPETEYDFDEDICIISFADGKFVDVAWQDSQFFMTVCEEGWKVIRKDTYATTQELIDAIVKYAHQFS